VTHCPICATADPADGLVVCDGCLARIDHDLERIVELTAEAASWSIERLTDGQRAGSRGNSEIPAPVNLDAIDAQTAVEALPLVESWERLTRDFYGLSRYGAAWRARERLARLHGQPVHLAHLRGCVGFLRSWLPRIAETPDYPTDDLAREVRVVAWRLHHLDPDARCRTHARSAPDRPCESCDEALHRHEGVAVPCPGDHPEADGRTCGYRMRVSGLNPADDVTCRRCGYTTSPARLVRNALYDPAVTVWAYPDVIVEYLKVNPATLRQWVHRGHVDRLGGRYNVGQVFRRQLAA